MRRVVVAYCMKCAKMGQWITVCFLAGFCSVRPRGRTIIVHIATIAHCFSAPVRGESRAPGATARGIGHKGSPAGEKPLYCAPLNPAKTSE